MACQNLARPFVVAVDLVVLADSLADNLAVLAGVAPAVVVVSAVVALVVALVALVADQCEHNQGEHSTY